MRGLSRQMVTHLMGNKAVYFVCGWCGVAPSYEEKALAARITKMVASTVEVQFCGS